MSQWPSICKCGLHLTNQDVIAIYDRDLDCTVAYECKACETQHKLPLAHVLSIADPSAFKEV